jgi:ABC-2 type transport system permease protein
MLKYLIEKEFKQTLRNPILPKLIILFPILIILVFPWTTNLEIKNIKFGVVDSDHSTLSRRLIQKIDASTYFTLVDVYPGNEAAVQGIENDDINLLLEIRPDFEKDLITTGSAPLMITANAVDGVRGGLGSSYLAAILQGFQQEMMEQDLLSFQNSTSQNSIPLKIIPQYKFNPHLNYKLYMIPALTVILLTLLCGFLPAINIVSEKEIGTMEQINVSPVGKFTFIMSKLIPFWIIGLIAFSLAMLLAALIYAVVPMGSLLTIYLCVILYVVVVSGMGLIISNYSSTMRQAMLIVFFFIMIMILISGLFTPINSMPDWAKVITMVNPLRYFMEIMRMLYMKGSSFLDMMPQLLTLAAFALLFNLWAVLSFRKNN